MRISVLTERAEGEQRVALVPENVAKLVKAGATVVVQEGAGARAFHADAAYVAAGATIADSAAAAVAGADVVAKVQRPLADEMSLLPSGVTLICMLNAQSAGDQIQQLATQGVSTLALERVPRITRAQSMDVLSSQATIAGYKAVLMGAAALPRILPMMTTAAGSLTPGKAFVIGAGVAGLQAIATARRLGAIVTAFDVRPAAAEQVQSLGATFVKSDVVSAAAEDKGGYAKAQSQDEATRTLETIGNHIVTQDLVITTAAIPGRAAPRLITAEMVQSMKPGSVIVDLAVEAGGNVEGAVAGEVVEVHHVKIVGHRNVPSRLATDASALFARLLNRPLRELSVAARRVRDGDFAGSKLNETATTGEIREVNIEFNRMSRKLVQVEQDRSIMLAGISHDLRTPLARLRLETELSVSDMAAREHMAADIEQVNAIINKFMDYARPDHVVLEPVLLADVVGRCVQVFKDRGDMTFDIDVPTSLLVLADEVELSRVVSNLLENAARYGKSADTGRADIAISAKASERWVLLEVGDHGPGVPADSLGNLTKAFFRGDTARTSATGAGLGLAIAEKNVQRMGGTMQLANRSSGGLAARIQLQRAGKS